MRMHADAGRAEPSRLAPRRDSEQLMKAVAQAPQITGIRERRLIVGAHRSTMSGGRTGCQGVITTCDSGQKARRP
jgi:hypothetical protein